MHTCLITGAGGFCARHLAIRLRGEGGLRVIGAGRAPQPKAREGLDEYMQCDVTDRGQVEKVVRASRPDLVFHLAGLHAGTVGDIYEANVVGTFNLLEVVRAQVPGARLLLVGTCAEYGYVDSAVLPVKEEYPCRPVGAYAGSKHAMVLAGLEYARAYGLRVVLARPFNIIGAGISQSLFLGAVIDRAREALRQGTDVLKIGNLEAERDFVAVSDVVECYVRMLRGDQWGQVFNLCSGHPYPVRSLIELALSHAPRPIRFEVDPQLVRRSEVKSIYGSWEKAGLAFGFEPRGSLESATQEAWTYAMRTQEAEASRSNGDGTTRVRKRVRRVVHSRARRSRRKS